MKHVQLFFFTHTLTILSSLLLLLAPVNCGEAAVIQTGETGAENPNVKECLLKPATIEPTGSDVQPSVAVSGCTTKPEARQ